MHTNQPEHNPIATADQFAAEGEVSRMWEMPVVKQARQQAATMWRLAFGTDIPPEATGLDEAVDEYVTNYLFKATACDPDAPRIARGFMPAYSWQGRQVPGARMGGDNPDNCYRFIGIGHGRRYRLTVTPVGTPPSDVTFTLVGNWGTSVTIQTVEWASLEKRADGSAVITIDDRPGGGNHLTTTAQVKFLFVRDSLSDWASETPLDLKIELVDGKSPTLILTLEDRAAQAAHRLVEEVPLYYWFIRIFSGREKNHMVQPARVLGLGGLRTQASAMGRFDLAPHEAVVIRINPAGARYCSLTIHDWWFRSLDAHTRQTNLTGGMATTDPDGWISFVVAHKDPGVANWIDTTGLRHTLPLIRWQGIPDDVPDSALRLTQKIVPLAELADHLPAGMAKMTPAGRADQLAARQAAFARRISCCQQPN